MAQKGGPPPPAYGSDGVSSPAPAHVQPSQQGSDYYGASPAPGIAQPYYQNNGNYPQPQFQNQNGGNGYYQQQPQMGYQQQNQGYGMSISGIYLCQGRNENDLARSWVKFWTKKEPWGLIDFGMNTSRSGPSITWQILRSNLSSILILFWGIYGCIYT